MLLRKASMFSKTSLVPVPSVLQRHQRRRRNLCPSLKKRFIYLRIPDSYRRCPQIMKTNYFSIILHLQYFKIKSLTALCNR